MSSGDFSLVALVRNDNPFSSFRTKREISSIVAVKFNSIQKGGYVYIMTNRYKTALYVGVTSNLTGRVYQHKTHVYRNSFTDKYNIECLVYYEYFLTIEEAILREKEIKKWSREKKEILIRSLNPEWKDLYDGLL